MRINEDIETQLSDIVKKEENGSVILSNKEAVEVDVPTANVLLTVLNALDNEHKERMKDLLDKNAESFLKVINFSWNNVE